MSWSSYFNIPISSKIRHNVPLRVIPNIINPSPFKTSSSFPVISFFTKTFATISEMSSILFVQYNTLTCVHSFTHGALHPFSAHFELSNYCANTESLAIHSVEHCVAIIIPLTLSTTTSFVWPLVKLHSRCSISDFACRRHSCLVMIDLLMSSENLLSSVVCGI